MENASMVLSPTRDVVSDAKRRGLPHSQVVDPAVSKAKFANEVDALRRHESEYREQGWFILSCQFPEVFVVLTAPQLQPAPVLFGVIVNFVNYDVDPLSVRLVNPWTRKPLLARELLTPLPRLVQRPAGSPAREVAQGQPLQAAVDPRFDPSPVAGLNQPPQAAGPEAQGQPAVDPGRLMQWWTPDSIPFLCMRGVREYHRHPAHTGDAWLLHRKRGEGTLAAILSAIHDHGRMPIRDFVYEFNMQAQAGQHNGFAQRIAVRVNGLLNVLSNGLVIPWSPQ